MINKLVPMAVGPPCIIHTDFASTVRVPVNKHGFVKHARQADQASAIC